MMPMYLRQWSNLPLKLSIFLMFQYSISSSKECGLKTTETSKHTYVRNSGIALCQHKCIENIICLKYEYHIETLTCHLSRDEIQMKEGYIVLPGNPSYVSNVFVKGVDC